MSAGYVLSVVNMFVYSYVCARTFYLPMYNVDKLAQILIEVVIDCLAGVQFPVGWKRFLFLPACQYHSETYPLLYWMSRGESLLRDKLAGS